MTESPSQPQLPDESVTLPSGAEMPLFGFGTWQIQGREAVTATAAALEVGYRHLDTATVYGNEAEVGEALRASGVARDDVFLTTKCPPNTHGGELDTLRESLDKLGTDYVDLWLIHWPNDNEDNLGVWRAFVQAQREGLARDIGVSNFDLDLIDAVSADTSVVPAVNQIEWSPLLYDASLVDAHRERGIAVEGYSALRGGTLGHPVIADVAERHRRTTAQVIIRWHLQHGIVVIPKSREPERIRSNADVAVFTLSDDDMAALDALGQEPNDSSRA